MNGIDIRKKILENNKIIAEQPHNIFILNQTIQDFERLAECCKNGTNFRQFLRLRDCRRA